MKTVSSVLVVLALVTSARIALGDDLAEAKRHFEAGGNAYELGDYAKAIDEYTKSFELSRKPLLLFDLAQCYRKTGDSVKALHFYRQYVAAAPKGRFRKEADDQIKHLEALVATAERVKTAPPNGVATEPDKPATSKTEFPNPDPSPRPIDSSRRDWYRNPIGWTLVGLGVGAVIAGGVVLGQSFNFEDKSRSAATLLERKEALDKIDPFRISGGVVLGVGIAAAVAGSVVLAVAAKRPRVAFSPVIEPGRAMLVALGRW